MHNEEVGKERGRAAGGRERKGGKNKGKDGVRGREMQFYT